MKKEITLEAKIENLDEVLDFVNAELEAVDFPMKTIMQIAIAVEEIFVNIAYYAYKPGSGNVTMRISADAGAVIEIEDSGKPFNPLEKEDADITKSVEEREIGGLGIFMVKKIMDSVDYKNEDGKNILTIRKALAFSST